VLLPSVLVYEHIYIPHIHICIYIYHSNDGPTEAEICCRQITLNNNIHNKAGNVRT